MDLLIGEYTPNIDTHINTYIYIHPLCTHRIPWLRRYMSYSHGRYMSYMQCVAVCCSMLQYVAVCCSVLQCVAVCCSVLQCIITHGRYMSYIITTCYTSIYICTYVKCVMSFITMIYDMYLLYHNPCYKWHGTFHSCTYIYWCITCVTWALTCDMTHYMCDIGVWWVHRRVYIYICLYWYVFQCLNGSMEGYKTCVTWVLTCHMTHYMWHFDLRFWIGIWWVCV